MAAETVGSLPNQPPKTPSRHPGGRPSKVAQIEERLGMGIEHHVAVEMAKGRTTRQIAAALKISERTLRHHLHARGYRINCDCALAKRPLRPGSEAVRRD